MDKLVCPCAGLLYKKKGKSLYDSYPFFIKTLSTPTRCRYTETAVTLGFELY